MVIGVKGDKSKRALRSGQGPRRCRCGAAALLVGGLLVQACGADDGADARYAQQLGEQVIAVGEAIREPGGDGAMEAIVELGTDSRHYTMVRGWLTLQLQGDQSIVDASEPGDRPRLEQRIEFLQRAIRAIDLE